MEECNHIPIEGFEWNYLISEKGNVYSKKNKKYLKLNKNQDGYFRFTVYNDPEKRHKDGKIQKRLKVHNTVAISFLGAKKGDTIHHIDGNKTNNTRCNLQVIDHAYHSFITNSKLDSTHVKSIFFDYNETMLTTKEICEKYELKYNVIVNVLASRKYLLIPVDYEVRRKAKVILKLRRERMATDKIRLTLRDLP